MLDNDKARGIAGKVVEPVARGLLKLGVTANAVTFTASLLTMGVAMATWSRGEFGLGMLLGVPFVFGDLLDGTMARLSGSQGRWGSFVDSVMDRFTDAALFGSAAYWLAATGQWSAFASMLWALAGAFAISYIRAKADALGVNAKVGLMERTERLAVLALAAIIAAFGWDSAIAYAAYLLAVLNTYTVWQRMHAVRRELQNVSG